MYKLLKYGFIMFSDYTNDKANVAGPGVYTSMLLLSMAFVLKLVTTIFTFGIKVKKSKQLNINYYHCT